MVGGINALMSAYNMTSSSSISSMYQLFDYKSAQSNTQQMLTTYKANNAKVTALKKDTSDFLTSYTTGFNEQASLSKSLMNGGLDKLLYDKNGAVTDDTVKATVDAVQKMVDSHNSNLRRMNDNADRGPGVERQILQMVDDPASKEEMKMVGISVNKDGTLAVDTEKLSSALKQTNTDQRKLATDIIGGSGGIAHHLRNDAEKALRRPANELVSNDLVEMRTIMDEDPIRSMAASFRGSYGMNAMTAGLLMNMLV